MPISKTVVTVVLVSVAILLGVVAEPAQAQPEPEHRFRSGQVYRGGFPDPDVFRLGRTWYAYGTTVGGRSLPMLTSVNGKVWRARRAHASGRMWDNDAMLGVPAWAARRRSAHRRYIPTWAPAVGRASNGRWLA